MPTPIYVSASLVTITRAALNHLRRDSKRERGAALAQADIERLPDIIAKPQAILWDKDKNNLLFTFGPSDIRTKQAKVAVEVEYPDRIKLLNVKRQAITANFGKNCWICRINRRKNPV